MTTTTYDLIFDSEDTKRIYHEVMRAYERDGMLYNINTDHNSLIPDDKCITRENIQFLINNYNENYSGITQVLFIPLYDLPMSF